MKTQDSTKVVLKLFWEINIQTVPAAHFTQGLKSILNSKSLNEYRLRFSCNHEVKTTQRTELNGS